MRKGEIVRLVHGALAMRTCAPEQGEWWKRGEMLVELGGEVLLRHATAIARQLEQLARLPRDQEGRSGV